MKSDKDKRKEDAQWNPHGWTTPKGELGRGKRQKLLEAARKELKGLRERVEFHSKHYQLEFGNEKHIALIDKIAIDKQLEKSLLSMTRESLAALQKLIQSKKAILNLIT